MKNVLARGGGEWVAWGWSGKGWHQLWVYHRRSNSTLVMRSPPQQHQQIPGEKLWGQGTALRKGRTQVCPPTTDAAAVAQSMCQGLCAGPTEPVVPKVQPLDIGIGG